MSKEISNSNMSPFERIKKTNEYGSEYWSARDLMSILDYLSFRNFVPVINRAQKACENSGQSTTEHFAQVRNMIDIGNGARREAEDYHLSRYACYLIVQNADSSKPLVSLGQTYFAVQTRKQEEFEALSEDQKRIHLRNEMKTHNTKLADAARQSGVIEPMDYAIFQNHGYRGLYGGLENKGIKAYKGLKGNANILDHMGSTELAANLFRATQTEEKLRREKIKGKDKANRTHYEVGAKVRKTIEELGGTMPEDLPVFEDINKIEKKNKKLIESQLNEFTEIFNTNTVVLPAKEPIRNADVEWQEILKTLRLHGRMILYTNLIGAKARIQGNTFYIGFTPGSGFKKMLVSKVENMEVLEGCISKVLNNKEFKIKIVDDTDLNE